MLNIFYMINVGTAIDSYYIRNSPFLCVFTKHSRLYKYLYDYSRLYLQNPDVGFRENDRALSRIQSPLPLLPERPIDHPFQGLLASQLECMECGYKNPVRYDHFDSLSLTFPQSIWVCPKMFTLSEIIALIILYLTQF